MPQDQTVNVRLSSEWLARAQALAERMERDVEMQVHGRVSRSLVIRLALLRGLEVLEQQFPAPPPAPTKAAASKKR